MTESDELPTPPDVSTRSPVVEQARFDPKLRTYLVLRGVGVLTATILGIALIPFWLVLGWRWARRYYDTFHCLLTERSLVVKRGIVFRQETTLPLDKIQDVSIRHGPLLDWLGMASLAIETAGASGATRGPTQLRGIVDVDAFRDRILDQRDRSVDRSSAPEGGASGDAAPEAPESVDLLRQIRDSLRRLEDRLPPPQG